MRGLRFLALVLVVLLDPLGLAAQQPASSALLLEGRTVNAWSKDLIHKDPSVREEAIRAMMFFGQEAGTDEIVKLILARTNDNDLSPRLRALQALGAIKIPTSMWPDVLKQVSYRLTEDPQVVIRAQASLAFCAFGLEAAPAIPALIKGTADPGSWEIRRACVHSLGIVGCGPKANQAPDAKVVNALLTCLKDPALMVRMETIYSLGALGKPAETPLRVAVESELLRLSKDKDANVGIWASMSLMCVTDDNAMKEKAIVTVRSHLKDSDARVRCTAARSLGALGSHARFAVVDLANMLKDSEPTVIVAAISTIAGIDDPGLEAKNALQALIDMKDVPEKQKDTYEFLKKYAQAALDHINKKVPPKKP
jgi:HEAT repeat protein